MDANQQSLMKLAANTIRCLAMDAVQKANSGHPGMPMGSADMAVVLWLKFLKFNPANPKWANRDRFILSAGHGSMLLYSLLHLAGYDLPMSQLKEFRQWGSQTPGHPEYNHTPGVETTTGPLGQGFANGVGMAIAARHLAAVFNEPHYPIVDNLIYGIVSDGDIMEGIASEAASLAGHLGLGNLIYLYDCNNITIEGSTSLTFSKEDVARRFKAYGWQTITVDGHDMDAVEKAIKKAKADKRHPSLIIAHTHIAQGSPNKIDTSDSHGAPLGAEEIRLTKKNLGFPEDADFYVPDAVYELFRKRADELKKKSDEWEQLFKRYCAKFPEKANLWTIFHQRPADKILDDLHVEFDPEKSVATRASSGRVLQALAPVVPNLVGGSADLAPSNVTFLKGYGSLSSEDFKARNIHFGIREHAMGGIMNGMALYGGIIPFGGTFLVFSDYMRPSIRLAALMRLRVVYVFTHDSIFLGEDGPTHQSVEHVAALRLIPGLSVIRPADAAETLEAWKAALRRQGPTALILSRQGLPHLAKYGCSFPLMTSRGAYVLCGKDEPADCIIMASGSEVSTALDAHKLLLEKGIQTRVVSFSSWDLFEEQSEEYKKEILPDDMPVRLAVEAGRGMGWEKYVGAHGVIHSIERFGASAPPIILAEKFGFTPQAVVEKVEKLINDFRKGER